MVPTSDGQIGRVLVLVEFVQPVYDNAIEMTETTKKSGRKYPILFEPDGVQTHVEEGLTLLDAARESGVLLSAVCGGKGLCGKCRVDILDGWKNLSAPKENEIKSLGEEVDLRRRLACCAEIKGPVSVSVPEVSFPETVILTKGNEIPFTLDSVIAKYHLRLTRLEHEAVARDGHRLLKLLEEHHGLHGLKIDDDVLIKLPEMFHAGSKEATVIVRDKKEIIDVEAAHMGTCYGVAFDIGTTTVVGYLVDLLSGQQVSVGAMTNPQVVYGENVMSRIAYSMEGEENRGKLTGCIRNCLNHILSGLCKQSGINRAHIYEMTVAGNTAMHHILLDLDLTCLSRTPFKPTQQLPVDRKPESMNLGLNRGANIHILPLIDGFVGADTVAVLISAQPHQSQEITAVIDIGTNGEIVAGSKEKGLKCCSTAAGPAFEGGHIRFGMRAAQGAIEQVRINPETYHVSYHTIGGTPPRGICGSGIMDAVAQMILSGIVQKNGRIDPDIDTPRILANDSGPVFILEWAEKTGIGRDIVITQGDIREVQLAKAALNAGAQILMRRLGVKKFQRIFLAGAFGNYIDKESALTVGLFPACEPQDIEPIGNAAGQGARLALISRQKRIEAAQIACEVEHVELNRDPDFERTFIEATYFP